MRVLGISPDVWISSAALIEDGRVLAAAAEERFNRQKMSNVYPAQAIAYCLREGRCELKDIDHVAVAWNPGVHLRSPSSRFLGSPGWRGEYLSRVPAALLVQSGSPDVDGIEAIFRTADGEKRIHFVAHHEAHAASAFFLSGFKRAAMLTVDGRGEEVTCVWHVADTTGIETLQAVYLPHSLGFFYGSLTQYLGFRPDSDEWKVMAMAAYGKESPDIHRRVRGLVNLLERGRFELDLTYFSYYLFDKQPAMYTPKLADLLGPPRRRDDPLEQRHYDLARALQSVFEETFTHMLTHLSAATGESTLALAGGTVMNSVYNGKIQRVTPFDRVFIPSCPDDTGVSVGAALHVDRVAAGTGDRPACEHDYWGPAYSTDEINDTLAKYKLKGERHRDIEMVAARMLSEGLLLGWFQGRMEFGQRALGNRSILADPRDIKTRERVNAAVKFREGFRPFAPSVLEERASEYFELPEGVTVPFMEKVFPVRPDKRGVIPAVVHEDGSSRVQTVSRRSNPRFYELIRCFGELTGVPVVLNTSFNLNGEPIVCSPTDAVRTFFSCGLDALVLGDTVLLKNGDR